MKTKAGQPGHKKRSMAATLLLAAAGALLFEWLSIPLAFLFGPMAACLIAALFGLRLEPPGQISTAARTVLGVAAGASVTPYAVSQIPQMAISIALLPIYLLAIAAVGVPFFRLVCRYDRVTAYYAAMPGGLQDMVIFGQEAGANIRSLSLIHATRVLILVTLIPWLLVHLFDMSLDNPIGEPASSVPPVELMIMVAAAIIGWKGGERIGLFGATVLGPLIVTAALSLSDIVHFRPPAEAILIAQYFIGIGIGVHYVGITVQEIRRDVLTATVFVIYLAILTVVFSGLITRLGIAEPVEAFLALAPGGQAEMMVLAIVAGADLSFVVVHHLTRMLLVIFGAPIAGRWLARGEDH